jgi:hypothetical protein
MVSTNKSSNIGHTAPRRAVVELLDQGAVDAAGIDLGLESARLVSCVIFRQAARGRSKTRTNLYDTIMGLVFLGRQAIERNGEAEPAPFPNLATSRWPQAKEVFRRLGFTNRDLEEYCRLARRSADDACLPLEVSLALFPAPIWPVIAKLIEWGPEGVALRMEWAAPAMAQTTTQRNRRRRAAGETLAPSTLEHYIGGVWQLMDVLLELRSIATTSPLLPLEPLDAWTTKPKRIEARTYARPANVDNSGPSLQACSDRLKVLRAEAQRTTTRNGYIKRRRALFMELLCLFGAREDAFLNTRVEDYLPRHRYSNGDTGPVLRIYPAKTWDPNEAHYLPLPAQVASDVEDWIGFTARSLGQTGEPLFPSRKPKLARTNHFLTTHGLYTAIAGAHQKGGTGSYALLPRGDDPFIGYHPHSFRHTALQLAVRAATKLQREDPSFYPWVHPQEFGKAIVGHELITDVGAIYRDLDPQLLCRAVVDEMWRLLWDDGVLRRGLDVDRVRQAHEQRDALRVTVDALHATIIDLETKADQAAIRARSGRDPQRRLELQLKASDYRLDAHARRDDLGRFQESLKQAQLELAEAQTTLVPIPEHITDAEQARRLAEAVGQPQQARSRIPTPALADEIPLKYVAVLFGTTPQTIGRWREDGQPKHRPVAWHGGEDAWHDHTQKDRRLRVSAINRMALTPDQERLLDEILIRLALGDRGHANDAVTAGGQLDAWETSGSSPPPQHPSDQQASE